MDTTEDKKTGPLKVQAVHDEYTQQEVQNPQTPWQCMKENPKVMLYTLYANLGSLMIGYDNLSLAVCLAMPAFQYVSLESSFAHVLHMHQPDSQRPCSPEAQFNTDMSISFTE